MRILSIETSCDETAISIVDFFDAGKNNIKFKVLGDIVASQIELHKQYGGVFPMLAKREHSINLIPLLKEVMIQAKLLKPNIKKSQRPGIVSTRYQGAGMEKKIKKMLEREPELLEQFLKVIPEIKVPDIDLIAVTSGPGLEPALWVGLNLAKTLSLVWNKPLIPINHMEGHIFSALLPIGKNKQNFNLNKVKFPKIALLISGGHTELVLVKDWLKYKIIGQTRDDAVGEAFDKVARMLGLPYPGGPQISKLAQRARDQKMSVEDLYKLPRPMISSDNFEFSFSGLKTAVLYLIKKIGILTEHDKIQIAREFEDSVTEVLIKKTSKALKKYKAKTLVIGGGVSANKNIRKIFEETVEKDFKSVKLFFPENSLATDNSLMIAFTAFLRTIKGKKITNKKNIRAEGNLRLSK